jgi:hypothetical protein
MRGRHIEDNEAMRGWRVKRRHNNQSARGEEEWAAQQEDKERRCNNKLAQREDEMMSQREDGERKCDNQRYDAERIAQYGRSHCEPQHDRRGLLNGQGQ